MKNTGTLSPGLGVSETILKMPASGKGFTSSGRFQPAASPLALAPDAALAFAAALVLAAAFGLAAVLALAATLAPAAALAPAAGLGLPSRLPCATTGAVAPAEGATAGAAVDPHAASSNDIAPAIAEAALNFIAAVYEPPARLDCIA